MPWKLCPLCLLALAAFAPVDPSLPGLTPAPDAAGVAVRVTNVRPFGEGRSTEDVPDGAASVDNPKYQSWSRAGLGAYTLNRYDTFTNAKATLATRRIDRVTAGDAERCRVEESTVTPDGTVEPAGGREHLAKAERSRVVMPRRLMGVFYWRMYRARVELFRPDGAKSKLPPAADCLVFEWAVPAGGEDATPDVKRCELQRTYNRPDVPGFEWVSETYTGVVGDNGRPADLKLTGRWRVERVFAPNDALPPAGELAYPKP